MDNYETLSKIGDGTFGTVYLCRKKGHHRPGSSTKVDQSNTSHEPSDELVAVKKMKRRYYSWPECMQLREVLALKKLNHKNIVLLKEVIRENDHLYLVFEHMEENLYQLMRRHQSESIPEAVIKRIVQQILSGLAHMHANGFFHRDIKPENLLCRNGANSIKIADFGLTREVDSHPPYTDYVSTRWYRAPELLLHSTNYSWAVDIWAVGCIMGELYTLKPTFPGRSEIDQIYKICQVLGPPNPSTWTQGEKLASLIKLNFPQLIPLQMSNLVTNCPSQGIDLIRSMLQWAPQDRPKAKKLLTDIYFKE